MRSATTAWAAALAVMSMHGPFTTAEAAPAQPQPEADRPKYYFPRHIKRLYANTTRPVQSSSSSSESFPDPLSPLTSSENSNGQAQFNPLFPLQVPPATGETLPTSEVAPTSDMSYGSTPALSSSSSFTAMQAPPSSTASSTSSSSSIVLTTSTSVPPGTSPHTVKPAAEVPPMLAPQSNLSSPEVSSTHSSASSTSLNPVALTAPKPTSSEHFSYNPAVYGAAHQSSSTSSSSGTEHPLEIPNVAPTGAIPHITVIPEPQSSTLEPSGRKTKPGSRPKQSSSSSSSPVFNPLLGTGDLPLFSFSPPSTTGQMPSSTVQPTGPSKSSKEPHFSFNPGPSGNHPERPNHPEEGPTKKPENVGSTGGPKPESVPPTARPTEPANATTAAPEFSSSGRPLLVGLSTVIEGTGKPSRTSSSTSSPRFNPQFATGLPIVGSILGTGPTSASGAENATAPQESGSSASNSSSTGLLPGIFPTPSSESGKGTYAATGTSPTRSTASETGSHAMPEVVSSVASQLSHDMSSILPSETSSNATGAIIVPVATRKTSALSDMASSLSSELAGAASSLASATRASSPSSVSATTTSTSETTGAAASSYESSLVASQSAAASSASAYSATSVSATTSNSTNTGSATGVAPTSPSSHATEATTYSTSVPLSTGATLTLSSSSMSTSSNSSETGIIVPTSRTSSQSSLSTPSSESSSSVMTQPASTSVVASTTPISNEVSSTASTSTSKAPVSVVPTGTDTATSYVIPSSIVYAPTTTAKPAATPSSDFGVDSSTTAASTGLPSAMPRLVQPPGGMPASPANATLVQVGFNYGLNFPFVVSTDNSASQIFAYLPQGIAYALGIPAEKVVMNALMPYDTTKTLNYITTLAQCYIPGNMVNELQLDLHTPMSNAYNNPDEAVHMLMSMINPTIPILPGANLEQNKGSSPSNPAATGQSGQSGDGAPIGGDSGSSQSVKGTSVGIGVGACAGAAVYAAAMVYVARRYRRKRQSHQRTPSVPATGDMVQRSSGALSGGGMGGYFMSGANGARGSGGSPGNRGSGRGSAGRGSRNSAGSSNNRSVREQGISAPVMAENSLGWN